MILIEFGKFKKNLILLCFPKFSNNNINVQKCVLPNTQYPISLVVLYAIF